MGAWPNDAEMSHRPGMSSGGRRRPFGVPSARVSTTHPAKPLKVVFNNQTSSWRHQKWA
jgi:hypothetical protein